jgi:transposase
MRDLPYTLSIAEFAKRLQCSVDTAKRWLKTWPANSTVNVTKSPGGHWSVELPKGDYSLLRCRLQRAQEKLFQRKQSRTAMPFMITQDLDDLRRQQKMDLKKEDQQAGVEVPSRITEQTTGEDQIGVDAPWMWQDVDGLFQQFIEEQSADHTMLPLLPDSPERETVIAQQLLQVDDRTLMKLLAPHVLINAAFRIQKSHPRKIASKAINDKTGHPKTDKKLTVPALAEALGISHASLYRHPFGKGLVQSALREASGGGGGGKNTATEISVGEAEQGGLHIGKLDERTYQDRKLRRDRKKTIKTRHFLCWHGVDWPQGRQATLALIPETEVDKTARPSYPKNPFEERLPAYSEAELMGILRWLEQNLVIERETVAVVSPKEDGSGYQWDYNESQYSGESSTWEEAAASVLKVFRPERFNRKFVILNPKADGLYQIPMCLPKPF